MPEIAVGRAARAASRGARRRRAGRDRLAWRQARLLIGQLADPGAGDFHLKSQGGRWQPGTGWVYDGVSSPLIDAGHPGSMDWTVEPDPNGRRRNIGLYGGTAEASKSPLSGWVTLISLNDGGGASGTIDLQWTAGGAATNYSVCLEYSPDDGVTVMSLSGKRLASRGLGASSRSRSLFCLSLM